MKIGTDSVLLGAWTGCSGPGEALDIGTGTGILALMIAQRCPELSITALEPEEKAFREARENIASSPWSDRITCYQGRLQEYSPENTYSLIIANPPFYDEDIAATGKGRSMARQSAHLPSGDLIEGANRLLAENGCFNLILPETASRNFILKAAEASLYLTRQCLVHPDETKPVKRRLLSFTRKRGEIVQEKICIRKNGIWSPEYRQLTQSYYLSMH